MDAVTFLRRAHGVHQSAKEKYVGTDWLAILLISGTSRVAQEIGEEAGVIVKVHFNEHCPSFVLVNVLLFYLNRFVSAEPVHLKLKNRRIFMQLNNQVSTSTEIR
jgi:hypothetical protein